ncbi:NUDIX domain-containing protein [Amaricoccus solimangrovi]|uniref:NUDIX hydrolase n=1 Tax=Amaricoccus solimangrovi TaxID=2589815 RepID=A0A501WVK3_9RHOB|nr:NUDIX hydrolase [Amaricoccus solimangrovi]TPE51407.1 NUDIX hydrolase [Amaricoccus solimangrovi]
MRRFGSPVDPRQSYRNRLGAYAVIRLGDEILLTEQAGDPPELQLPGGGIDPGEGALRAMHRECLEETGWTIRPIRRLGVYQRYAYMPEYDLWARKVCHVYLCRPGPRHGPPREAGHRAVWMPIRDAVGALSVDGDSHFTRLVAEGLVAGGGGVAD